MKLNLRPTQATAQLPVPMLQQSLKLLAMNASQLSEYMQEEILRNPLLEFPAGGGGASPDALIAGMVSRGVDWRQELLFQLRTARNAPPEILRAAQQIVQALDEDGYLREELTLPQAALLLVQGMEPPGVGARNLQECLLLQLRREESPDICAIALVETRLDQIPRGVAPFDGFDAAQIAAAITHIRGLNPRPCGALSQEDAAYSYPDVILQRDAQTGRLTAALVEPLPPPEINAAYAADLRRADGEARAFLNLQMKQAKFLRYAIQRRGETLLAIANCILERQYGFFNAGEPLARLNLSMLAEACELSISTVSRAISSKNLLFGRRLYPLSDFLQAQVASGHSANHVSLRIAQLIAQASEPLSDQAIARLLEMEGVRVGRSTVNKYRRAMGLNRRA